MMLDEFRKLGMILSLTWKKRISLGGKKTSQLMKKTSTTTEAPLIHRTLSLAQTKRWNTIQDSSFKIVLMTSMMRMKKNTSTMTKMVRKK